MLMLMLMLMWNEIDDVNAVRPNLLSFPLCLHLCLYLYLPLSVLSVHSHTDIHIYHGRHSGSHIIVLQIVIHSVVIIHSIIVARISPISQGSSDGEEARDVQWFGEHVIGAVSEVISHVHRQGVTRETQHWTREAGLSHAPTRQRTTETRHEVVHQHHVNVRAVGAVSDVGVVAACAGVLVLVRDGGFMTIVAVMVVVAVRVCTGV